MRDEFGATIDELGSELSGFVSQSEWTKMTLQIVGAIAVAVSVLIAVNGFSARGPNLLLLIFIAARLIPRISMINQQTHSLLHDMPAFAQAQKVLQECRMNCDYRSHPGAAPFAARSIGVRGVTVVSNDGSNKVLLDDISLELRVREVLAIEGPSGAGKSTLADVLSGLVPPESGDIFIDGDPLGKHQIVSWRKCVGYVQQTAVLLQGTIEHNLNWVLPQPATMAIHAGIGDQKRSFVVKIP